GRLNSGVRSMDRVFVAAALVLLAGPISAAHRPVPKAAATLVTSVHAAAVANDQKALKRLMAKDFVSSFGGDGGPTEALALWASDPTHLQNLAKATSAPCELQSPDYVECPRDAGIGFRAGFKLVGSKWVFASFVAGD
ncbi:hypothetical protein, partial [Pseudoxanthomonas sp. KAs_5_3]|uniref:hypothetical protein n=1 Tax=Pseudoxanthomonas sp. KAs_5_3 TaxID=2067658 RepID=UPI001E46AE82